MKSFVGVGWLFHYTAKPEIETADPHDSVKIKLSVQPLPR